MALAESSKNNVAEEGGEGVGEGAEVALHGVQ